MDNKGTLLPIWTFQAVICLSVIFSTSQSRTGYLRGCLPAFVYDLVCLCNLPYDRLPICLSVLPPVCLSDRTPTCALFAIKLKGELLQNVATALLLFSLCKFCLSRAKHKQIGKTE